ncbi:beta-N-acetylhexosaminidase [Frankineae bacterium MT45]|nr:beta-N-acetylhexosaminidase [Frankineae bacterium MT45]
MKRGLTIACAAVLLAAAAGCGSSPAKPAPVTSTAAVTPSASPAVSPTVTPTATPSAVPTPAPSNASRTLAGMTEAQRVGQLFMIGTSSTHADAQTLAAIRSSHVGSVILDGTSTLSVQQTLAVVNTLQNAAGSVRLFVSTDQEGGEVQRLTGPGFVTMPSGLEQGQIDPATLMNDATDWGHPLKAAGVNFNLAPVLDTVPSAAAAQNNPPIGQLDRQFGYTPATVATHGVAVIKGYQAAAVATSIKHFPGLGRVTGNTDTTAGVTDSVTTSTDPYLAPFKAGIDAGSAFVMMSTAIYSRIDPANPAAFSRAIIAGLLRNQLGFKGVVISDDLGAAQQVASVPAGERAVRFIAAGGDMVLSVDPGIATEMTSAVLARAASNPAFRAQVDAAALLVLQAKQRYGLI